MDRSEIVAVLHRYAQALDARDWGLLATCFTPDAVALYDGIDGEFSGYGAIEGVCRAALRSLDASQHLVGSPWVEVDGDGARSRCHVQAQHVRHAADGGPLYTIAGTYHDAFVLGPEGWRIHRRELKVSWTAGNPAVMEAPS